MLVEGDFGEAGAGVVAKVAAACAFAELECAGRDVAGEELVAFFFRGRYLIGAVDVAGAFGCEEHLHANHYEDTDHAYEAGHGWIAVCPKGRQTWVCERDEGCGE